MNRGDALKVLMLLMRIHPDPYGMHEKDLKEKLGWSEESFEHALKYLRKEGLIEGSEDLVFDLEDPEHPPISVRWVRITQKGIDFLES